MKTVVAMLDRKAGFSAVNLVDNVEIAKRDFGYAINNQGIPAYAPADFELYKIGEFDPKTGKLTATEPIEMICSGMELISR